MLRSKSLWLTLALAGAFVVGSGARALAQADAGRGAHPAGRVAEILKHSVQRLRRGPTERDRSIARRALVGLGEAAVSTVESLERDEIAAVRRIAVTIRGEIGDPGAPRALAAALADSDWSVRVAAAMALGRLANPFPPEPLLASLRDPIWAVRAACAWALRVAPAERVVAPLTEAAFHDLDADVRDAALQSLRALQTPLAVPAFVAGYPRFDASRKKEALRVILAFGDASTSAFLKRVVTEPDRLLRLLATRRLVELGDRSELERSEVIRDLLDAASASTSTAEEQRVALDTLERIGQPVISHVISRLREGAGMPGFQPEPLLRVVAAVAGERWIAALTALPSDPALAYLRSAVYHRLGRAQDRGALPYLLAEAKLVRSSDERRHLVEALTRFDDSAIREALVAALDDASFDIVFRAIERLLEFGDPSLLRTVAKAVASIRDPATRCRAILLFSNVSVPEVVPVLLEFLSTRETPIREAVLSALSPSRGEASDARLLKVYRGLLVAESDVRVRKSVVNNLGIVGGEEAIVALFKVLRYDFEPAEIRRTALQRLVALRAPGLDADLLRILADDDEPEELRITAARALGAVLPEELPLDRTIEVERILKGAISEGGEIATAAIETLKGTRAPALVRLVSAAAMRPTLSPELRGVAIDVLGSIRAPEAESALRSVLAATREVRDGALRASAIHSLGERANPASMDAVLSELREAESQVLDSLRRSPDRESIARYDDSGSRLRECLLALARISPETGAREAARALLARETLEEADDPEPDRFVRDVVSALRLVPEAAVLRALRGAIDEAKADGRIHRIPEELFMSLARELEKVGLSAASTLVARLVLETSPSFSRSDIVAARALGVLSERAGRYAESARSYELAYRIARSEGYLDEEEDRDRGSVPEQLLQAAPFVLRGLLRFRENLPDLALDDFTRAAFLGVDDWNAQLACARNLLAEGKFLDLALRAARRADRLSPSNPDVLWTLAELQDRTESAEAASATLRRLLLDATVTQADKARVLQRLAAVYVELGRRAEALASLERAVRYDASLLEEVEDAPEFRELTEQADFQRVRESAKVRR